MSNIITDDFNAFRSMWGITVSKTKKPLVWRIKLAHSHYIHYDLCMFALKETFAVEFKNKDIEILSRNLWDKPNTDFPSVYIKFRTEADESLFVLKTY
jgi:hypothetical protein